MDKKDFITYCFVRAWAAYEEGDMAEHKSWLGRACLPYLGKKGRETNDVV